MPYGSIAEARKASFPTSAEDIELTLAQINKLAQIYDAIKAEGKVDNAMAVAWTSWKEVYEKKEDKWVKREKKKSLSNIPTLLGLKIQDMSHEKLRDQIQALINRGEPIDRGVISYTYIRDVYDDHFVYEQTISGEIKLFSQPYKMVDDEIQLNGEPKEVIEEKKYIEAKPRKK